MCLVVGDVEVAQYANLELCVVEATFQYVADAHDPREEAVVIKYREMPGSGVGDRGCHIAYVVVAATGEETSTHAVDTRRDD